MENSHFDSIFLFLKFHFLWIFLKGLASNAQTNPNIEKTPTPWQRRQKLDRKY